VANDILIKAYLTHRAALIDCAVPVVGSRFRAEDVVQDAYFKLNDVVQEEAIRQPVSYLFRLVRNLAIDRARRITLELRHGAGEEVPVFAAALEPSPEQALAGREMIRMLELALAELPDRTRTVFEMNRVGGYSVEQIARSLDVSQSLVYSLLRDAMTHCRARVFGSDQ
jgi:RNA polymerase sigma-70 factor (ECF subfamily)